MINVSIQYESDLLSYDPTPRDASGGPKERLPRRRDSRSKPSIFSIINCSLLAPAVVQEIYEVRVDVADVAEGETD